MQNILLSFQTPVENPLVIVGLPRTGTTMLHRLLKSGNMFISPMLFEMLNPPIPPGRPDNFKDTERYRKAEKFLSKQKTLACFTLCFIIAIITYYHKFVFSYCLYCHLITTTQAFTPKMKNKLKD